MRTVIYGHTYQRIFKGNQSRGTVKWSKNWTTLIGVKNEHGILRTRMNKMSRSYFIPTLGLSISTPHAFADNRVHIGLD